MNTMIVDIRNNNEMIEFILDKNPKMKLSDTMLTNGHVTNNIIDSDALDNIINATIEEGLSDLLMDNVESINPEVLVQIDGDRAIITIYT